MCESTTQIFCTAGTQTYLLIRFVHLIPGPAIPTLLASASTRIADIIDTLGDGVIRGGYFQYTGGGAARGLELYTQNYGNHQQTWGVLGAAVAALQEYMISCEWNLGGGGSVQFSLYDGGHEVAVGTLGPA